MRERPFEARFRRGRHGGNVAQAVLRMGIAIAAYAIGLTAYAPVNAGGGGGFTGGALEITQLSNHAELIKQVAQQAQIVSNQIREYATLIQNLRQLPENWIREVTMPYREAFATLMSLKTSVEEVRKASITAGEVFARRMNALKLLDMTPQQYLDAELRLAEERGGAYQTTLEADLDSLQKAATKAQSLKNLTDAIPSISGNVEGLQNLAAHTSMMAGELIELRTSIQRQHALLMEQKREEERGAELQAQRNMRAIRDLELRRKRDAEFTLVPFKYPEWK